jgi:peptidoglycan hydrolase-like protein with peptidoglycan-binding domain
VRKWEEIVTLPSRLKPNAFLPNWVKAELDFVGPIAEGSSKKQVKWIQERLSLAGFPVAIDSNFGPATTEQLKNFQRKVGRTVSGTYSSDEHELLTVPFVEALNPIAPAGNGLGEMIVAVARQHIKQRPLEIGGQDSGPWVRMYMSGHDGPDYLWCAGFCFFAISQACNFLGKKVPMQTTFSVDTIVERAKAAGQFHRQQEVQGKPSMAVPGSLFAVRRTPISYSHVGIVSRSSQATISTCEGNTNDNGSSNGFEAIERVRDYSAKDFVIW